MSPFQTSGCRTGSVGANAPEPKCLQPTAPSGAAAQSFFRLAGHPATLSGWLILILVGCLLLAATGNVFASKPIEAEATTESARSSRLPLAETVSADITVAFEPVRSDRLPNYLLMWSVIPGGDIAMADMAKAVVYGGTVNPELKMAMGLAIAEEESAGYTAAHMSRLLAATSTGQVLLDAITRSDLSKLNAKEQLAIDYARALTWDVNGLNDEKFSRLRGHFTEPQIVELTIAICFFTYFNRVVEAINLPIESWAREPASQRYTTDVSSPPNARIGLLMDEEVLLMAERLLDDRPISSMTGQRVANSMRAMSRVPEMRRAWSGLSAAWRGDAVIDGVTQHYISNEVSYRNDCHYCKTHQVQKLRNAGIPIRQIALAVDDWETIPPRERQAVIFARRVTDDPTSISDEEFASLRDTFGDRGAFEVLQVAARFNFMNRFTSGLGLPAEAAPEKTYQEVESARQARSR